MVGLCICVVGACMAGAMCGRGACIVGGVHGSGDLRGGGGVCMAGKITISAGSTYPTGMHSCFIVLSQCMISGKLLAGLIRLLDSIFK